MTMRDFKMSCLSDCDMRQYTFTRDSKTPRGTFDSAWYRRQDVIVVCVCVAVLTALLVGIVQ
jgi:hypothetical protein